METTLVTSSVSANSGGLTPSTSFSPTLTAVIIVAGLLFAIAVAAALITLFVLNRRRKIRIVPDVESTRAEKPQRRRPSAARRAAPPSAIITYAGSGLLGRCRNDAEAEEGGEESVTKVCDSEMTSDLTADAPPPAKMSLAVPQASVPPPMAATPVRWPTGEENERQGEGSERRGEGRGGSSPASSNAPHRTHTWAFVDARASPATPPRWEASPLPRHPPRVGACAADPTSAIPVLQGRELRHASKKAQAPLSNSAMDQDDSSAETGSWNNDCNESSDDTGESSVESGAQSRESAPVTNGSSTSDGNHLPHPSWWRRLLGITSSSSDSDTETEEAGGSNISRDSAA